MTKTMIILRPMLNDIGYCYKDKMLQERPDNRREDKLQYHLCDMSITSNTLSCNVRT